MTATEKTKNIIEARIAGLTPDVPVREFEIRNIEKVMEDVAPDALMAHPGDDDESRWERIQFYKNEILARFAAPLRPRLAAAFHQYVASTLRGAMGGRTYTLDESGCVDQYAVA